MDAKECEEIAVKHGGIPTGYHEIPSWEFPSCAAASRFYEEATAAGFDVWGSLNLAGLRQPTAVGAGEK